MSEPVAWTTMPDADDWTFISGHEDPNGKLYGKWFPLYPADPQPHADVPRLSDEDFDKLIDNSDARWAEDVYVIDSGSVIDLLRAVEAEVLRRMGVVE